MFFDNMRDVMVRYPELGDGLRIYNLDETALTTVHTPKKVLAALGTKRLNKVTSAERGTLVTGCCICRADGTFLPPTLIFPRKNFKNHMLNGAPVGTLGLATKTGWMTSELFVEVLKHFIKHSSSSLDHRTLLIYDNHESHIQPDVVKIAKENGVSILTIPPHCSDRMQPLDVSVYRSLKEAYNTAADSWMSRNPGQTITIYNISEIFGIAFEKSMTAKNIKSGFSRTGIFPFDPTIFNEEDFMRCEVTNRPYVQLASEELAPNIQQVAELPSPNNENGDAISLEVVANNNDINMINVDPTTSSDSTLTTAGSTLGKKSFIRPEDCIGLPKAKPRKTTGGRKKGKSCFLTNTPEMERIRDEAEARKNKPKGKMNFKKSLFGGPKAKKIKKKARKESSESEELEVDRLEVLTAADESDAESFSSLEPDKEVEIITGDFYLVKFLTEEDSIEKYYVGKLVDFNEDNDIYNFHFMRLKKSKGCNTFAWPQVEDQAKVGKNQIMSKVRGYVSGTTSRQQKTMSFHIDFSKYNLY